MALEQDLYDVRALLTGPHGWCPGGYITAADANGEVVSPDAVEAVAWSVSGAIQKVCGEDHVRRAVVKKAIEAGLPTHRGRTSLFAYLQGEGVALEDFLSHMHVGALKVGAAETSYTLAEAEAYVREHITRENAAEIRAIATRLRTAIAKYSPLASRKARKRRDYHREYQRKRRAHMKAHPDEY